MLKSLKAIIDTDGKVRLTEPIHLKTSCCAIVTIIDDTIEGRVPDDITLLSEHTLAVDWNRTEEDEAWSHLQKVQ